MIVKDRVPPFAIGLVFGTVLSALLLSAWYAAVIVPRQQEQHIAVDMGEKRQREPYNVRDRVPATVAAGEAVVVRLALPAAWQLSEGAPAWLALRSGKSNRYLQTWGAKAIMTGEIAMPALRDGRDYRLQGQFYFCPRVNAAYCSTQGYDQKIRVRGDTRVREIMIKLAP